MSMKRLLGCVLAPLALPAADMWFLEKQNYFEPMVAEPRAARISLTVPMYARSVPYARTPGWFWGWDVALGAEIPMLGWDRRPDRSRVLGKGEWGLAILAPVSFHMMEDLTERSAPSAPILNTDYRFGSMVKYGLGLSDNWRLAVRGVPWAHESTHLGDEFTIFAIGQPRFKRVNVSYEYWELAGAVTVDQDPDPDSRTIGCLGLGKLIRLGSPKDEVGCRTTFKGGYLRPWPYNKGYYEPTLLVPPGLPPQPPILPSVNNGEWHFGVETLPLPTKKVFRPFFSVDGRWKPVYDYEKTDPARREDRKLSWNIMVGLSKRGPDTGGGVPFNVFFRVYHGVNPHGQFRNQPNFTLIGVGIHVPVL
jgi:hypothetical protein